MWEPSSNQAGPELQEAMSGLAVLTSSQLVKAMSLHEVPSRLPRTQQTTGASYSHWLFFTSVSMMGTQGVCMARCPTQVQITAEEPRVKDHPPTPQSYIGADGKPVHPLLQR